MMTIQVEVSPLAHTFEFDEVFFTSHFSTFHSEGLAVPADGVRQIYNVLTEGFVAIKGVWQRHLLPATVIKVRLHSLGTITYAQSPVGIEIKFLSLDGTCRQSDIQSTKSNDYLMCSFSHNI